MKIKNEKGCMIQKFEQATTSWEIPMEGFIVDYVVSTRFHVRYPALDAVADFTTTKLLEVRTTRTHTHNLKQRVLERSKKADFFPSIKESAMHYVCIL